MKEPKRHMLTLAMYLNSRGFSFVLFKGARPPYACDWGIFDLRGPRKDQTCVRKMKELLDRYDIGALVIQDTGPDGTRRALRLSILNAALEAAAIENSIPVFKYSRADVHTRFASAKFTNKQTLAQVIAKHVPELARHVPPPRKPWMTEDARMGLFDAAALAFVFFRNEQRNQLGG
jgi:hypothetical protein